jgi:hypothetical protein
MPVLWFWLAFTVAKAMNLDILQTVRDAVSKAIAEGQSERTFKQNLEPLLKQKVLRVL